MGGAGGMLGMRGSIAMNDGDGGVGAPPAHAPARALAPAPAPAPAPARAEPGSFSRTQEPWYRITAAAEPAIETLNHPVLRFLVG